MFFQRQRDAGGQTAAAATGQHIARCHAKRGRLFGNLQPAGALTGDHQRFVIGADQGQALIAAEPFTDVFARFDPAFIQNHVGPQRAGIFDFQLRRVGWHDDDCARAQQFGSHGDALRVVAAGIGQHAACAHLRVQMGQRRPRAAELEAAGVLQAFGFHQHLPSGDVIEKRGGQHGRAARVAL